MFNVSALLLDDASKTATPLSNGTINQTLRQFTPLSDDRLLQLVDCCESNWLDLSPGCLGATWQARSTLITQLVSGVADLSASSGISQGSVATHLRSGGIYSDSFITNCFLILTVKNCENRLIFSEIIRRTKMNNSLFSEIIRRTKNGAIFGPPCILVWAINWSTGNYRPRPIRRLRSRQSGEAMQHDPLNAKLKYVNSWRKKYDQSTVKCRIEAKQHGGGV